MGDFFVPQMDDLFTEGGALIPPRRGKGERRFGAPPFLRRQCVGPEYLNLGTVGAPSHGRNRCAEHGGCCRCAFQCVPSPPRVLRLAPPEIPRTASRAKSERPRQRCDGM